VQQIGPEQGAGAKAALLPCAWRGRVAVTLLSLCFVQRCYKWQEFKKKLLDFFFPFFLSSTFAVICL